MGARRRGSISKAELRCLTPRCPAVSLRHVPVKRVRCGDEGVCERCGFPLFGEERLQHLPFRVAQAVACRDVALPCQPNENGLPHIRFIRPRRLELRAECGLPGTSAAAFQLSNAGRTDPLRPTAPRSTAELNSLPKLRNENQTEGC